MPKTFCNEPIHDASRRHECKTERGTYLMGGSWIDTTSPSDMMEHDFTDTWRGLKEAAEETRRLWNDTH